jgi:CRP-like cAMP-binding protein
VPDPIPLSEALPELTGRPGAEPTIDTELVPPGPFRPERVPGAAGAVVVLLVSGLVVRTTALEDGSAADLLGPGAVLSPPGSGRQEQLGLPGYHVRLEALATSRVGLVGGELLARLADRPELVGALLAGRGRQDAERAALHAICQVTGVDRRLLALFRLLAARHGRPTGDGVMLPVAVPQRLLAELVGAARPTVTAALRDLRERGELRRLSDGTWLLQQRRRTVRRRTSGRFERRLAAPG